MKNENMVVTVLGMGYIGLPTALLIAKSKVKTFGFDIDNTKIQYLNQQKLYFQENGLEQLFKSVTKNNYFIPTTKIKSSDAYIIAVPTPQENGAADLKYVVSALNIVKKVFKENQLIVIESTVGPSDCRDVLIPLIKSWNIKFNFSHCPERAIPGNTLHEMVNNDRIIGAYNANSSQATEKIYSKFVQGNIYSTDETTAAACKVMENTYRAVNIALANEFSSIAEKIGFNFWEAKQLANKHPRVNIHDAGLGVGGHCIPIDPWFFVKNSKNNLINKALLINDEMPIKVSKRISRLIKKLKLRNPKIAIFGYSYKKNIDDFRETPAEILHLALKKNFDVKISDPYVKLPHIFNNYEDLINSVDIVVIATDHDVYKKIDFNKYKNISFIFDSRNSLEQWQHDKIFYLGKKN